MATQTEKQSFIAFLRQFDQVAWDQAVDAILPSVDPVDQAATRIWFRFWPLRLHEALEKDPDQAVKALELNGEFRLSNQIESSISYFYASCHWAPLKEILLWKGREEEQIGKATLLEAIRQTAKQAAEDCDCEPGLLLGLSAAGLMILRQAGREALAASKGNGMGERFAKRKPEQVLKRRRRKSGGWLDFLRGSARRHLVVWDEADPEERSFKVVNGQDLSWAAGQAPGDFANLDPRRTEGPIPAQCRSAACGFCWVGILEGRESLDGMTPFEQRRLHYFGYHPRTAPSESHPTVRLACQAKCRGDVTLVVPPWNGVLDGER